MITARVVREFDCLDSDEEPTTSRTTYELEVAQTYSPDVAEDLMRRVTNAAAADRATEREGWRDQ